MQSGQWTVHQAGLSRCSRVKWSVSAGGPPSTHPPTHPTSLTATQRQPMPNLSQLSTSQVGTLTSFQLADFRSYLSANLGASSFVTFALNTHGKILELALPMGPYLLIHHQGQGSSRDPFMRPIQCPLKIIQGDLCPPFAHSSHTTST